MPGAKQSVVEQKIYFWPKKKCHGTETFLGLRPSENRHDGLHGGPNPYFGHKKGYMGGFYALKDFLRRFAACSTVWGGGLDAVADHLFFGPLSTGGSGWQGIVNYIVASYVRTHEGKVICYECAMFCIDICRTC